MTEWVAVVQLSDVTRSKRIRVEVHGEPIVVWSIKSKLYALADTCIHKQRSLSKGVLLRDRIVCPGHQWEFDPQSGYEATQNRYQPTYDVKVGENDTIYVASTPRRIPGQAEWDTETSTTNNMVGAE